MIEHAGYHFLHRTCMGCSPSTESGMSTALICLLHSRAISGQSMSFNSFYELKNLLNIVIKPLHGVRIFTSKRDFSEDMPFGYYPISGENRTTHFQRVKTLNTYMETFGFSIKMRFVGYVHDVPIWEHP
ncbi:hypothetical protein QE152_g25988 [Popillia japonica]|uniref:Uncharacterized protein n=1 Tax=Popillia japonica TaxID=7064 RepID=A0AAW1JYL6_POPJA